MTTDSYGGTDTTRTAVCTGSAGIGMTTDGYGDTDTTKMAVSVGSSGSGTTPAS